jgi:hypothetical protein
LRPHLLTSFHHQAEAQHHKSSAIHKNVAIIDANIVAILPAELLKAFLQDANPLASISIAATAIKTPSRRIRSVCCAQAVTGQATAAPPTSAMNSRRLICLPLARNWRRTVKPAEWKLSGGRWPMSALGQKATCACIQAMSDFTPPSDVDRRGFYVGKVPTSDFQQHAITSSTGRHISGSRIWVDSLV